MEINYTIKEHTHNFAIWTAARAVQRNFTNTSTIKKAIEATQLKTFIDSNIDISSEQFDSFHLETAEKIIEFLESLEIPTSFGRAAKIIAIYIKTSVIIKNSGTGSIAKVAHPPIDSILLRNLNEAFPDMGLKDKRWTKLEREDYLDLIKKLRSILQELKCKAFWEIESYWSPEGSI